MEEVLNEIVNGLDPPKKKKEKGLRTINNNTGLRKY
jgi:hypothetical protein